MRNLTQLINRINRTYNNSEDILYEMYSLFETEKKYDIREISRLAANNMRVWASPMDWANLNAELRRYSESEDATQGGLTDLLYQFMNSRIDVFFDVFSKQFGVELEYLNEKRDEILYNIMEQFIPPVENRNEVSKMPLPGEDPDEDPVLAKALRQSREQNKPSAIKDYSKMSKYDLRREVDKALDAKDYDTLRKIQPFIKDSLLIKIHDVLNEEFNDENFLMNSLNEGCNCGGGIIRRPKPKFGKSTVRPISRPAPRPGAPKSR